MEQRRAFLIALVALFGFAAVCGGSRTVGSTVRIAEAAPVVRSVTMGRGVPVATATVAPKTICIGGTTYATTLDDEFASDTSLNYSPALIDQTPQPNGAIWSSRAHFFSSDNSRNNVGTDDAYYTDPTRGLGTYSPFSFSKGALTITAIPVPSPYATAPSLEGAHWLSGLLESPALTYGYVEVYEETPTYQGTWPAGLWLLGLNGSDGQGHGYEEFDVNELFGLALPPSTDQQTQQYNTASGKGGRDVRTVVTPNAGTSFHRYGVLWTPQVLRFYIDRVATSPDWPNAAFGPANAIINLGVFTQNTWSPGPANNAPITMSLWSFRWYQTTSKSCSPSNIPS